MPRVIRIHHIGFAHDAGVAPQDHLAGLLGLEMCHAENGPGFVERMIPVGDGFVQTLEATGPGVIEKFVGNRGNALHHVAFEVDDLAGMLARLRDTGTDLIDSDPRPGGMGTMIAFIHPREFGGLLVELVEVPHP